MKLIAIHDSEGRIYALSASPPNSPMGGMEIRAGQLITELEEPEMKFDLNDPKIGDYLAEVIESHLVKFEPVKARLIRKAHPAS
jgi:hypothetical protein